MTFIKYTNDGKAVIQPAALILSGLDTEDALEMHTLENAIVLFKQEMEPSEKVAAVTTLLRLTGWVSRNSAVWSFSSFDRMPTPVSAAKNAPPRPRMLPHSTA